MRTTVDLDPDLLARLREEAHRRRIPFKQVLNAAIRAGLANKRVGPAAPYVMPVFPLGSVLGGQSPDKALSFASALEDREVAEEMERRR